MEHLKTMNKLYRKNEDLQDKLEGKGFTGSGDSTALANMETEIEKKDWRIEELREELRRLKGLKMSPRRGNSGTIVPGE